MLPAYKLDGYDHGETYSCTFPLLLSLLKEHMKKIGVTGKICIFACLYIIYKLFIMYLRYMTFG